MGSAYRPAEGSQEEPGLQVALDRLNAAEEILRQSGVPYQRLFIGSQTQRVLSHTQIPVLTLH